MLAEMIQMSSDEKKPEVQADSSHQEVADSSSN